MGRIQYLDNIIDEEGKSYLCPSIRDDHGARGVTFWGDNTERVIPYNTGGGNGKLTYVFSPGLDIPADYDDIDNVAFLLDTVHTDSDSSNDDVKLRVYLNDNWMHDECHSKKAGHDFWLGIDLGADPWWNDQGSDEGRNWVTIENWGDVDVSVKSCSIYRVYMMNDCPFSGGNAHESAAKTEHLPNIVTHTTASENHTRVFMDNSIEKYRCDPGENACGYTFWKDENTITINPNDYLEYRFNPHLENIKIGDNYLEPYSCSILLDKMRLSNDSNNDDVPIRIKLNGDEIHTEYHSKKSDNDRDIWIGLMPVGSGYYDDDAENRLRIENLGDVNIQVTTCFIYRTYKVKTKT